MIRSLQKTQVIFNFINVIFKNLNFLSSIQVYFSIPSGILTVFNYLNFIQTTSTRYLTFCLHIKHRILQNLSKKVFQLPVMGSSVVQILSIFIHPNLGYSSVILQTKHEGVILLTRLADFIYLFTLIMGDLMNIYCCLQGQLCDHSLCF